MITIFLLDSSEAALKGSIDDSSSLYSLHKRLFSQPPATNFFGQATESKQGTTKIKLPPLPQKYFVHLWRSLHDLVNLSKIFFFVSTVKMLAGWFNGQTKVQGTFKSLGRVLGWTGY